MFQSSMRRAVVAVNATTIAPQIVVRRGKSSVAPLSKRFPRDNLTINHPNTMLEFDASISSSASVWQEEPLSTAWFLHPTTDVLIPPPAAATKNNNNNNRPTKTVITSLQELLQKVPGTVKERKDKNIAPGSPNDPVIQLFRYVLVGLPHSPTLAHCHLTHVLYCIVVLCCATHPSPLYYIDYLDKRNYLPKNGNDMPFGMHPNPTRET
jgi:hypothetical protein